MLRMFDRRTAQPPPTDARFAIVLSEAVRALEGQQSNLDNLHSRVGILLSAATIATSFLGGIVFARPTVGWPGIVAVVLFAIHVVLCLWILKPRRWKFQTSAKVLIDSWITKDKVGVNQLQRALARRLDGYHDRNEEKLVRLWDLYGWAMLVLAAEVGMWLGELGGLEDLVCQLLCR